MNSRQKISDSQTTIQRFYDHYLRLTAILHQQSLQVPDPQTYIQIVMNRLIFLHFLQSSEIIAPDLLPTLFKQAQVRKQNFFQEYFLPLCFQCLNVDPSDRDPKLPEELREVIYIPGELFARDEYLEGEPTNHSVDITNDCWSEILNVFGAYQWSIVEQSSPTVITPGILGYIFEKTIDQHETGSYYTPKQITTYICVEAIENYLTRQINTQFATNYGNIITEISKNTITKPESRQILVYIYFELLQKLTICDNACGTGAFLVAAVEVLTDTLQKIYPLLENFPEFVPELERIHPYPNASFFFKTDILRHNIFGVDLQPGAIEIAKARLWSALLATIPNGVHPTVLSLPPLEFHLRVGNSLIGGVAENLLEEPLSPNILAQIRYYHEKIAQYNQIMTNSSPLRHEILTLHRKINTQINQMMYDSLRYLIPPIINTTKSTGPAPKLGGLDRFEQLQPFYWFVEFGEVFAQGGFDILVGNPPFIRHEKVKHLGDPWHIPFKDILKRFYTPFDSSFDLSMFFILRSLDLLKPDGMHAYIITSKWTRARYGTLIKNHIYGKNTLIKFLDLTGIRVFVGATVDTVIFLLAKTLPQPTNVIRYNHPSGIDQLDQGSYTINQADLQANLWTFLPQDLQAIKTAIDRKCITTNELHLKTYRGITTGYNNAFILSEPTKSKLIRQDSILASFIHPVLIGEDLMRYCEKSPKAWILVIPANSTQEYFLRDHPALNNHFQPLLTAVPRGKGRGLQARDDQGAFWWELRPCDYYTEFLKPKLIWQRVTQEPRFYLDVHQRYLLDSTACLRADLPQLKYLQVIFSSSFIQKFFMPNFVHQYGDSGYLLSNQFVAKIPICPIDDPANFELLADYLSFLYQTKVEYPDKTPKCSSDLISEFDNIADLLVYELYMAASPLIQNCPFSNYLKHVFQTIPWADWSEISWKGRVEPLISSDQAILTQLQTRIIYILQSIIDQCHSDPLFGQLKSAIQNSAWVHAIEHNSHEGSDSH